MYYNVKPQKLQKMCIQYICIYFLCLVCVCVTLYQKNETCCIVIQKKIYAADEILHMREPNSPWSLEVCVQVQTGRQNMYRWYVFILMFVSYCLYCNGEVRRERMTPEICSTSLPPEGGTVPSLRVPLRNHVQWVWLPFPRLRGVRFRSSTCF